MKLKFFPSVRNVSMNKDVLRAIQAPVKQRYVENPQSALVRLKVTGEVDFERIGCRISLPVHDGQSILAGLHPAAGGNGTMACSGELLLQALISCAGTTLAAVATAMDLPIRNASLTASGLMDFRGTMGVDRTVPVGITEIQIAVCLDTDATDDTVAKLLQLTERYCVVFRTLADGVRISSQRSS